MSAPEILIEAEEANRLNNRRQTKLDTAEPSLEDVRFKYSFVES